MRATINDSRGFAALIAIIVLGALVSAAVAAASIAAGRTRAETLEDESHAQARALADGCANVALTKLLTDHSYAGNETVGNCRVLAVLQDSPRLGTVTIRTNAVAHGYSANVRVVVRTNTQCDARAPISAGLTVDSWNEIPSHD
jgi:type II secretory pathway component PulK